MAPGDLAQSPRTVYMPPRQPGPLAAGRSIGTRTARWNAVSRLPYNLGAAQRAFRVTGAASPRPSCSAADRQHHRAMAIATSSNGKASWLKFTVGAVQAGNWCFAASSPSPTRQRERLQCKHGGPSPLRSHRPDELNYTYDADGNVQDRDGQFEHRERQRHDHLHLRRPRSRHAAFSRRARGVTSKT